MRGNVGDYATLDVVHYIQKRHGLAPAAKIFPQIGTFAEVANPATATLLKDIAILKAINRQIAAESVINFFKNHYPGEFRPAEECGMGDSMRSRILPEGKGWG